MNIKNLLLATTAALFAACSTDNDVLPSQDPGQIRVTASVGAMTRVAHSGNSTTFETNDRISVYAWLGADNDMKQLVVDNSINTLGSDGTWTANPQMFWVNNVSNHYFLGIYPERIGTTDYDADPYTLDFNNQTGSDLLVAKTMAKPTGSAVKLEFEHVMAKLVVNLSFRDEWTIAPEVTSVTAEACTEATVNYLADPVEVTPAAGQNLVVIPFTGTSNSYAGIMIPGQSDFRTIKVKLKDGKVYTYTHPTGIDLQPGKYTTVNLVLGRDRIKTDNDGISVSDWEENGTAIDGGEINADYSYDSNTQTITIYSGEGLKVAADMVNSGDTDINITLDNDIDLTEEWTPIGNYEQQYTGIFDGNGKTITGLTFNQQETNNVGLIGRLGENGIVRDVKLDKVNIKANNNVGGIVGGNNGGSIIGCSVSGDISGARQVGGVVGYSGIGNNVVTACYHEGSVSGSVSVGGVAGDSAYDSLTACYHAGNVSGSQFVGGVTGYATSSLAKVIACYWSGYDGNGSGIGSGEATKVDGTTVTWQTAVDAMNAALQNAGSEWRYELTGELPTLKK